MSTILIFATALAAFLLLSIGQGRYGTFSAFAFLKTEQARVCGWVLLVLSAMMSVASYGLAYGIAKWLGLAMAAALIVVLFLCWRRGREGF